MLRVGIIGFGLSGRFFHTPLLKSHEGYRIDAVCTSRTDEVRAVLPAAKVAANALDLISDPELDLIINCAPNSFHYSYTAAALEHGKHVVVEKPFVNTKEEGTKLIALAQARGKVLSVFHNRRWDADFLTVQRLLKENKLGEIKQFESHFDRWRPTHRPERWREQAGEGSGIFYDLGAHLIDQALTLFGLPQEVIADIAIQKENGVSDDYFHLILKYDRLRVILHSSSFTAETPRFQIFGDEASFIKYGLDPQEEQLKQGISPLDPVYGVDGSMSERGNYRLYYDQLHGFILNGKGENPVSPEDALKVIEIIALARHQDRSG